MEMIDPAINRNLLRRYVPRRYLVRTRALLLSAFFVMTAGGPAPAADAGKARVARASEVKTGAVSKSVKSANGNDAGDNGDVPDPRTSLPPPEVEMDVVTLLAAFPRAERAYVQQVVHTVKDLGMLNKQCSKKAGVFWQRGYKRAANKEELDLADVSKFNQGYLRYFDPLRAYLRVSYKRLYALPPPAKFEKAHKYWLAYLAYALENLDHQRNADKDQAAKPTHSAVEVTQYRAWAYRLFKENGLDLTTYLN